MPMMQAIYVPADDLTDPAPATTFAHLDATTVLSRSIAELGIYPAVDPLDSTSRMLSARILGQEHYDTARGVQRVLQVSQSMTCFTDKMLRTPSYAASCQHVLLVGVYPVRHPGGCCADLHLTLQLTLFFVCRTTRTCRILLPSWVWMSCLRRTS